MKKAFGLAAIGLFALSSAAWAGEGYSCGGYQQTVQTEQPTITLAPGATVGQTASTETETTKPGS